MSISQRFALLASVVALSYGTVRAETYEPPKDWQGAAKGTAENNPVAVDGKPQWRFVQAWPDDLGDGANLIPLIWTGEKWQSDGHGHAGQPDVSVNRSTVTLGSRGAWSGDDKGKGGKWAGVAFVAPEAGTYTVEATASADVWTGDGPVELVVLKVDGEKAATELATVKLAKGGEAKPLEGVTADLLEGEEVVLVARVKPMHTAANVKLAQLKIVTAD